MPTLPLAAPSKVVYDAYHPKERAWLITKLIALDAFLPHVKAARASPLGDKHRRPPFRVSFSSRHASMLF